MPNYLNVSFSFKGKKVSVIGYRILSNNYYNEKNQFDMLIDVIKKQKENANICIVSEILIMLNIMENCINHSRRLRNRIGEKMG